MSAAHISVAEVLDACRDPFPNLEQARGMAERISAAGWVVRYHTPPVELQTAPGELAVASVYTALMEPISGITYRAAGDG